MTLEVFVFSLLGSFPSLLVWMIGLVACVFRYSTEGRRCVLAGAALSLFLLLQVTIFFVQDFILNTVLEGAFREDGLSFGARVFLGNLIVSLPYACGYALLIWAAVGPVAKNPVEAGPAAASEATLSA
jgi:hypothetical protein